MTTEFEPPSASHRPLNYGRFHTQFMLQHGTAYTAKSISQIGRLNMPSAIFSMSQVLLHGLRLRVDWGGEKGTLDLDPHNLGGGGGVAYKHWQVRRGGVHHPAHVSWPGCQSPGCQLTPSWSPLKDRCGWYS